MSLNPNAKAFVGDEGSASEGGVTPVHSTGERGKKKESKSQRKLPDPSALLNFRYERPSHQGVEDNYQPQQHRARHNRARISKAEHVLARYLAVAHTIAFVH